MGDYQRCLDESVWLTDPLTAMALVALGRLDEARTTIKMDCERFATNTILRTFVSHMLAFAGGSREDALRDIERLVGRGFRDGEGLYYKVRSLARLGSTSCCGPPKPATAPPRARSSVIAATACSACIRRRRPQEEVGDRRQEVV